MLDSRKKRILQAIIEEYIETAEPVSSGSILKSYDLGCSSATIRNDMADLELVGYLDKPHTSAGRIPSNKGYRFYVDELLKDDKLSIKEMEYIKSKLETKVNQIQELSKIASETLSEMTHYTSVLLDSDVDMHKIVDIKFMLLGNRMVMAVILTDAGVIKESIIRFNEDISAEQVDNLNYIFNSKLIGQTLGQIDISVEQYIKSEMVQCVDVMEPVIEQLNKEILKKNQIHLEGTNKLLDFPELKKFDNTKNFLDLVNEKEMVAHILNNGLASDINIHIGNENDVESLKNFSIVTFKHVLEGKHVGTIGIIGPTRMNYSKVVSIMKYISKYLNGNE